MSRRSTNGDSAPDPRLKMLVESTEPSELEVSRLLARRPTRADAEALMHAAQATEPTWSEEFRVVEARRNLPTADPRVRFWARATEPTPAEVAQVGPAAPPYFVASFTEPTEAEVLRLCARRAELITASATGSLWATWGARLAGMSTAAVVAGLLVLLVWFSWPSTYGTPGLPVGQIALLTTSEVIDLGPSIDLQPHAIRGIAAPRVHIAQANARGTVVEVLEGGTRFEVDPNGKHRALTVLAGNVAVHVRGTVFTVDKLPDGVEVGVERGKVQVDTLDGTVYLLAGQRWHSGEGVAQTDSAASSAGAEPNLEPAALQPDANQPAPVIAAPPAGPPAARSAKPRVIAKPPVAGRANDEPSDRATDQPHLEGSTTSALPADAAGPWVTDETRPAAQLMGEGALTAQSGVASDELGSSASGSNVALPDLHALRKRFEAGEPSRTLLPAVDRIIARSSTNILLPMLLELRVDVTRRDGTREEFARSIAALERHRPNHPDRGRLYVDLGRRWLQVNQVIKAEAAFAKAAAEPTDIAVHGLIGIADCQAVLGRPAGVRQALTDALRIVMDPALEDELKSRLNRLDRR